MNPGMNPHIQQPCSLTRVEGTVQQTALLTILACLSHQDDTGKQCCHCPQHYCKPHIWQVPGQRERGVSIIWDKKVAGFCTAVPYLLLPAVAAPPGHWTGGEEGQQWHWKTGISSIWPRVAYLVVQDNSLVSQECGPGLQLFPLQLAGLTLLSV